MSCGTGDPHGYGGHCSSCQGSGNATMDTIVSPMGPSVTRPNASSQPKPAKPKMDLPNEEMMPVPPAPAFVPTSVKQRQAVLGSGVERVARGPASQGAAQSVRSTNVSAKEPALRTTSGQSKMQLTTGRKRIVTHTR